MSRFVPILAHLLPVAAGSGGFDLGKNKRAPGVCLSLAPGGFRRKKSGCDSQAISTENDYEKSFEVRADFGKPPQLRCCLSSVPRPGQVCQGFRSRQHGHGSLQVLAGFKRYTQWPRQTASRSLC